MISWTVGAFLTHRFNPELGVGRITAIEGRTLIVDFPATQTTLRLAASNDALVPAASADAPRPKKLTLVDKLAEGGINEYQDFLIRLDMLRLQALREAQGLGSFLGGRVRLFPHQLYVAERATQQSPVRWLLADEVGLGKTIEACLILNRLVHTGGIERCLVVAPEALTVQWLGELWRKYHQVFTLLDSARLADVAKDFGADFNPFDVHRRVVVALETLVAQPGLTTQAVKAGIDLLVVDEAQHLRRRPGHPGEPGYRAVAPIAALGRHVLLLSATPLQDDVHGFLRLVQLLRPEEFGKEVNAEETKALPPCTSATTRADIGGLPPRVGYPIALGGSAAEMDAAARPTVTDPRVEWLAKEATRWKAAGDKTLIFVHRRDTLEALREALGQRAQLATGVFHEELSTAQRDTQVARFREAEGPSLLISTEAGGEGRNFEFCRRLVLFDLPDDPSVVEQRIGRLDRIGRKIPVDVFYFVPSSGPGREVVERLESLGLFRAPYRPAALRQVQEDAYQALHRDPYRADMAAAILARVPQELDSLMERVIVRACLRLGFRADHLRGNQTFAIEFGNEAIVDSLPGAPGGSSWVGTFDREEAVADEEIDFFSSGHALVEGIIAHYQDGAQGRVAWLDVEMNQPSGDGLVAIYKHGPQFEVVAIDADGQMRTDWALTLRDGPMRARGMSEAITASRDWRALVRTLAPLLPVDRRPEAVAVVRIVHGNPTK